MWSFMLQIKIFAFRSLLLILLPGCFQILNAQDSFSVNAWQCDKSPIIDGTLDDDAWKQAPGVNKFFQREPVPGDQSTLETEFQFCYDADFLYIAVQCLGNVDEISAKEMARDVDLSNDDRIQVILDTHNDKRNAYWFQIGPRGSIGDAIISENGFAFNKAWDGLWEGKASIHEKGWSAELAIPFKTLNFDKDMEDWGLKLIRYQKSREEMVYWPVANINTIKFQVSDAGILSGLEGISQGLGLDLVPYGLGGLDIKEVPGGATPVINGGFEAYYNITPGLKAALTVNTDFAQTEVDQQEINLTRFSLFYPEKRDFFLDGANYFNFGINGDQNNSWNRKLIPFFSRRIGLDGQGSPIPVQLGGKLTGQGGHWNIGAMYMKDLRPGWQNGNFAVSRISRNLGEQSQLGMVSTYGNSLFDTSNFVLGLDLKLATSKFRGNKNVSFTLYGLKSFTATEQANESLNDRNLSFGAELSYPNDNVSFRLGHMEIQENFIAGIGFVPRPGVRESYADLTLGYRPGRWGLMQVLAGGGIDITSGFDGTLLTREWNSTPLHIRLLSGDVFKYRLFSSYEYLEKSFILYNVYEIPEGEHSFFWNTFSFESAKKRAAWAAVDYRKGSFYNGSRNEVKLRLGYQIAVPVFVGGELIRNDVRLEGEGFIANVYRLNLNILFSPDITLYTFVQYDSQSNRMGWQSRFQWILKPGREIFLVWNSLARDPFERYQMEEGALRLKLKYTVRF